MAQVKSAWSNGLGDPIYAATGNDSVFWFSPDAEAIFAAEGILSNHTKGLYRDVFGDDKIENYRHKHRMVMEIFEAFSDKTMTPGIYECLQGFDVRGFTLASFRDHVMSIGKEKLPGILLDMPVANIEDLVDGEQGVFGNYLGAVAYFTYIEDFIDGIFTLAEELRTDLFYKTLSRYGRKIEEAHTSMVKALAVMTPLEYSDKLMRKKMWRRGPYSFFTFAPTVFSQFRTVRYMGGEQFLFFTVQDAVYDNEKTLKQLKALADDTRFRIIELLKDYGGLQGLDIVRRTGLSASTVSHHMKLLREAGLVHEEAEGTIKYYSLPIDIGEDVADAVKRVLSRNK